MSVDDGKRQIVTIDGPAGVGKSTVSLRVARAVGFSLLDTGAMYRGVGFYLAEKGISLKDETVLANSLAEIQMELYPANDPDGYTRVVVNGRDITKEIRSPEVSMIASEVSSHNCVRAFLTKLQRQYGEKERLVAEGRDMGSVVFPNAAWKFYLDATPEVRARRRCLQLEEKKEKAVYQEILAMIIQRDQNDREREIAPLCKAEDAVLLDTTTLSIEQVVAKILERVRKRA